MAKAARCEIQRLESYLERSPTDSAALTRLAALKLISPPFDENEVRRLLSEAIDLEPSSTEARYWLGELLFHYCCDPRGAVLVLKEALSIDPRRADCLCLLASALSDAGEPLSTTVEFLQRAVREAPDWVTLRQALAVTLIKLGQPDEAKRVLVPALHEDVSSIPAPTDPLENYYEYAVTGRISRDTATLVHIAWWASIAKWWFLPQRISHFLARKLLVILQRNGSPKN